MGKSHLFKIVNYLMIHKRTTASCLAEVNEETSHGFEGGR